MELNSNFSTCELGFTPVTPARADTPRYLSAAYHDPTSLLWVP
jgi:hypothetical protein